MKYEELKKLKDDMSGKAVCIFGAGRIGSTWAFDLIKTMGFDIDFYCDNNKEANTTIREKIKTISIETLYSLQDDVLVFIAVGTQYQDSIKTQLESNGIHNIVIVDFLFLSTLLESLNELNDKNIDEQFKAFLDDTEYLCKRFEYVTGCQLNLDNPQTFNEKIQWLKLHDRNPEYTRIVDKYAVKKYIADKIGEEYIIPTLGIFNTFDEIEFDKLPQQFVLKCTHDTGSIVICRDKSIFDVKEAKKKLNRALRINTFWGNREWPYKNVKPRIIAEQYMVDEISNTDLKDYKLMMFHGELKCSFVCTNRRSPQGLHVTFFDPDWNIMPFERYYPQDRNPIPCPKSYKLMCNLASKLSEGIPFVRVDFYEINGKVYFGELTFYPGSGFEGFSPVEWDKKLGDWIILPEN